MKNGRVCDRYKFVRSKFSGILVLYCFVFWSLVVLVADIDWLTASDLDKYIVTLYWAVTTITSVGCV